MNTNLFELATATYVDNKGVKFGDLIQLDVNSVVATTNNTLYVATVANDAEIKFNEYKLPLGPRVLDSNELAHNIALSIDYTNYKALNNRINTMEDKDDVDYELIEKLRATRDIVYTTEPVKGDRIACLIVLAMLSTSVFTLKSEELKPILSAVNDNDRKTFNKLVTDTIQSRECDYIKNTSCKLNVDDFAQLRINLNAINRKWNKRGITQSTLKDKEKLRQILLTVFETEYCLTVKKKSSKNMEEFI